MTNHTKQNIELLKVTRANILETTKDLSFQELTTIPDGFSNSIIWNIIHLTVTEQLLCYGLSGNEIALNKEIIAKFRKGSSGKNKLTETEYEDLKTTFIAQPLQLEKDFDALIKSTFNEYPTSYNYTLSSLEDAIRFNTVHEALHFGIIMSLIKIVRK